MRQQDEWCWQLCVPQSTVHNIQQTYTRFKHYSISCCNMSQPKPKKFPVLVAKTFNQSFKWHFLKPKLCLVMTPLLTYLAWSTIAHHCVGTRTCCCAHASKYSGLVVMWTTWDCIRLLVGGWRLRCMLSSSKQLTFQNADTASHLWGCNRNVESVRMIMVGRIKKG